MKTSAQAIESATEGVNVPSEKVIKYLEQELGLDEKSIERFKRDFTKFLFKFRETFLPYEYLAIPYVSRVLRDNAQRVLKSRIRNLTISDSDWTQLYLDFAKNVEKYCCGGSYDPQTNNLVGFLVNHFTEHYIKSINPEIVNTIIGRGINDDSHEFDFAFVDLQHEEFNPTKDFDRIDILARKIYNVSDFMFRHNNEIYYDLFSRYKYEKLQKVAQRVRRLVDSRFNNYASLRKGLEIVDANFKVTAGKSLNAEAFALQKLKDRDRILAVMDPLISGQASLDEVNQMMISMLEINKDIVNHTDGKDARPVFAYGNYYPKDRDKFPNDKKLELIFLGMSALKQFIDYLRDQKINVFSVPSNIFRDERIIRRFTSFITYMQLIKETDRLIKEEKPSKVFVSNDDIYNDIMSGNESINNIPLRSIKDIIDEKMEGIVRVKRDKPSLENEFDSALLARAQLHYNKFFSDVIEISIPSLYAQERRNWRAIFQFLQDQKVLVNNLGKWEVKTDIHPKTFFETVYSKSPNSDFAVKRALYFSLMTAEDVKGIYLNYFRSLEFIEKFLMFVREILLANYGTPKEPVVASSKFRVFLIINDKKRLFDIPTDIVSYSEISHILDAYGFEYFVQEGKDLKSINTHLTKLYSLMYNEFKELFDYVRSLYNDVYMFYVRESQIEEKAFYDIPVSLLKEASVLLYGETLPSLDITNYPKFRQFKNMNKVDPETGFFIKSGKLYRKIGIGNITKYLHETGYWVSFVNGKIDQHPISNEDDFGLGG